jgi:hypothetical protein
VKKVGIIVLSCVTVLVLGATPGACVRLGMGENLGGDGPSYYYLLTLVPLVVVAMVWAIVFIASRKMPPRDSKGATEG